MGEHGDSPLCGSVGGHGGHSTLWEEVTSPSLNSEEVEGKGAPQPVHCHLAPHGTGSGRRLIPHMQVPSSGVVHLEPSR